MSKARFESTDIRIVSLTVIDSAVCAIIRLVLSDPERAYEILQQAKFPFTESDLLVVQLPDSRQPILEICRRCSRSRSISTTHILYLWDRWGTPPWPSRSKAWIRRCKPCKDRGFTLLSENDFDHQLSCDAPRSAAPGSNMAQLSAAPAVRRG